MTLYLRFQINVLANFDDTTCSIFYVLSAYLVLYNFMCHCIDYKLSGLQIIIPEKNTLTAMTASQLQEY